MASLYCSTSYFLAESSTFLSVLTQKYPNFIIFPVAEMYCCKPASRDTCIIDKTEDGAPKYRIVQNLTGGNFDGFDALKLDRQNLTRQIVYEQYGVYWCMVKTVTSHQNI